MWDKMLLNGAAGADRWLWSTGDRETGRSFQKTLRDCRIIRLPVFRFIPSVLSFVQPIAYGSTRDQVPYSRLSIVTPLALTEGPSRMALVPNGAKFSDASDHNPNRNRNPLSTRRLRSRLGLRLRLRWQWPLNLAPFRPVPRQATTTPFRIAP
jgi:hypothetical protein